MSDPTHTAGADAMPEALVPVTRAEVRACIGPTIPLRRRWVDLLMRGPIARLHAEIARLTGEREVAEMLLERRKVDLRAAEAETVRLRAALQFYADKAAWSGHSGEPWQLQFESPGRDGHGWEVALEALK